MTTKVCPRCNVEKPIEEFALRNKLGHLRQSHCIECGAEMGAAWYIKNRGPKGLPRSGTHKKSRYFYKPLKTTDLVWCFYLL